MKEKSVIKVVWKKDVAVLTLKQVEKNGVFFFFLVVIFVFIKTYV